jgi:glycine/D-amino acid oxidase-like deaminating enzyme
MQSRHLHNAVVIGAGICGAATAYFLTRRGVNVRLLDARAPAAEATGAADGAVSVASKRPGPMMNAALSGIRLYRELAETGLLADLFKTRSTFIVAMHDDECAVLEAHAAALAGAGVSVEILPGAAARQRFSALSPATRMAVEVRGEGHAIGYRIVHRLIAASGIAVERHEPVTRLILCERDQRIRAVETAKSRIEADAVIVAAGGGSGALLGLAHVLSPRKGQLLVTERAMSLNAGMPGAIMSGRYLMSKGSQAGPTGKPARGIGLVVDPLTTGQFLIGGTREDGGEAGSNDIDAVARILTDAVALVPGLARVRLLRGFAGVRMAVADGLPLIGRLPGLENGFVVTGFEGDGICLGPIAAQAIVALACGEAPALDLTPFDPGRFDGLKVAA